MGWTKRIAFCTASLVGCYAPPDTSERFEDSIVVTSRDETTDFGTFQTFFVRPEVRVLDENQMDGLIETLPPQNANPLVNQTTANLEARGYRAAATKEEADLAVELVYLRAVFSDYYCYYWSDWYYWGYPGYYYYYPYSCSSAAWRSGMVVTNVIDLASAGPPVPTPSMTNEYLRGVWFSGVYGVESDTSVVLTDRAVDGIDQAFDQSPYFTAIP